MVFRVAKTFLCVGGNLYGQLVCALESISLSHNDDSWEFRPDRGGMYSVTYTYAKDLPLLLSLPGIQSLVGRRYTYWGAILWALLKRSLRIGRSLILALLVCL
ncbi:hypothetical protein L195_g057849, partial [Trifolium pratense]